MTTGTNVNSGPRAEGEAQKNKTANWIQNRTYLVLERRIQMETLFSGRKDGVHNDETSDC